MSFPRLTGLILTLVTLLVYLPVTGYDFSNFDDGDYVTGNHTVQQGLTWAGIKWAFGGYHASNWHPLTWLSHMLDCDLFHLNPGGHHLMNVLFHSANAVLLFVLMVRLTGRSWPSAFIAALFAWHPLHVESVAWISERKDVLSTLFALLALLSYTKYVRTKSPGDHWLTVFLFALGLMAKPMLVTLPFVMLLLDFWPLNRFQIGAFRQLVLEKWPLFVLSIGSCIITYLAQRTDAVASLAKAPLDLRIENVLIAYADYLFKTVWPVDLAVFYPLPKYYAPVQWILAAVLLAAISAISWRLRKSKPYLITGWLWFLGTLVPVIGLVQVGDQALADRYTYFPLIGIFMAVTFAIAHEGKGRRFPGTIQAGAGTISLAACLMLTTHQLQYWRNSETLFTHDLEIAGGSALAHLNLGTALESDGKPEKALTEYQKCLEFDPNRYEAWNDIAKTFYEMNRPAEALTNCLRAEQLNPGRPTVHNSLGLIYARLDRTSDATNEFLAAIRLNPEYAAPCFQMGEMALKQGNDTQAVSFFHQALRLEPDNFQTLIRLARVLASDESPQVRNSAEAMALGNTAAALVPEPDSVVLDTMAMAYAEAGRFDDAIKIEDQAIQLADTAGQKTDAAEMRARSQLYKNHQPWRESFQQKSLPDKSQS
jgi:tetratricopeptide (TPR) repeat protein